jgi:hypothetical protein
MYGNKGVNIDTEKKPANPDLAKAQEIFPSASQQLGLSVRWGIRKV